MTRAALPRRRPCRTIPVRWGNHVFGVSIGFCPVTGAAMEVFYSDGMRTGADLLDTVQSACVMASKLRQHGDDWPEIAKSVPPEGIIGALLSAVVVDLGLPAPEHRWGNVAP
jgi:hypothetical protein